jgi:hypothetical protein
MLTALIILIPILFVMAFGGAALLDRKRASRLLLDEDAAFEGIIDYHQLTSARIAELKPFVDRAGLMSRGIRESNSRYEQSRVIESFDVFVIDVNGIIHDVLTVDDADEAARIARDLAIKFEVPLEDPGHVLSAR